jgi:hypothetical protein
MVLRPLKAATPHRDVIALFDVDPIPKHKRKDDYASSFVPLATGTIREGGTQARRSATLHKYTGPSSHSGPKFRTPLCCSA